MPLRIPVDGRLPRNFAAGRLPRNVDAGRLRSFVGGDLYRMFLATLRTVAARRAAVPSAAAPAAAPSLSPALLSASVRRVSKLRVCTLESDASSVLISWALFFVTWCCVLRSPDEICKSAAHGVSGVVRPRRSAASSGGRELLKLLHQLGADTFFLRRHAALRCFGNHSS